MELNGGTYNHKLYITLAAVEGERKTMELQDRLYKIEIQRVTLNPIKAYGMILDVGGGGEGIIGQLMGNSVVSIDSNAEELMESPGGPLKIIMAAEELKFLNNTFDTVTSFFTMMYIDKGKHRKVFNEIYRVLKPEGELLIWDAAIPEFGGGNKDIFLVPLEVELPEKMIATSYGVKWKDKYQNIDYYISLAEEAGFKAIECEKNDKIFFIKMRK